MFFLHKCKTRQTLNSPLSDSGLLKLQIQIIRQSSQHLLKYIFINFNKFEMRDLFLICNFFPFTESSVSLNLSIEGPQMTLNFWLFYLHLPSTGIAGIYYHSGLCNDGIKPKALCILSTQTKLHLQFWMSLNIYFLPCYGYISPHH